MSPKGRKLFGTDGIRGTANVFPMTTQVVNRVGMATGYLLRERFRRSRKDRGAMRVVIGKDTRLSGYMVEMALASGLNAMGVDVQLVGPLPTPGIGYLARNMRADAGIVISASHNPYQDNGIKIFGPDGFKISQQDEEMIERLVESDDLEKRLPPAEGVGRSKRIEDSLGRYIVFVKNTFPMNLSLDGLRVVLDCANGAAYKVGPAILEELGAEVIVLGDEPNGTNINDKCGALYPDRAAQAVIQYRADVGITLDGDADRVIMIDGAGQLVNGDRILAICGLNMARKGELTHNTIVTTQMANFGLEQLMKANGITLKKTAVGDRYVVEEMRSKGYVLGGESSGHIIFLNHATTGDGLIAALRVLSVMKEEKKSLAELNEVMNDVPQVLRNIRVGARCELEDVKGYPELVGSIEKKLNGEGRVFVRFSGTEPVVRVLVEGPVRNEIARYAEELAVFLQKSLG